MRVRTIAVLALVAIAAIALGPRAVHAYGVREAKVWCEELARQIRVKYGPGGPAPAPGAEGPETLVIDVSEFEATMPEPPALIKREGFACLRHGYGFRVYFGWAVGPNRSEGWDYDSLEEEWKKVGYIGPG